MIIKSKKSLYGTGFALTTGPPAKTSGQSLPRSDDFNGSENLSRVENIDKKSISNVNENPIKSTFSLRYLVVFESVQSISILTSSSWSISLNIHRYPSEDNAKDFTPGNASHTV